MYISHTNDLDIYDIKDIHNVQFLYLMEDVVNNYIINQMDIIDNKIIIVSQFDATSIYRIYGLNKWLKIGEVGMWDWFHDYNNYFFNNHYIIYSMNYGIYDVYKEEDSSIVFTGTLGTFNRFINIFNNHLYTIGSYPYRLILYNKNNFFRQIYYPDKYKFKYDLNKILINDYFTVGYYEDYINDISNINIYDLQLHDTIIKASEIDYEGIKTILQADSLLVMNKYYGTPTFIIYNCIDPYNPVLLSAVYPKRIYDICFDKNRNYIFVNENNKLLVIDLSEIFIDSMNIINQINIDDSITEWELSIDKNMLAAIYPIPYTVNMGKGQIVKLFDIQDPMNIQLLCIDTIFNEYIHQFQLKDNNIYMSVDDTNKSGLYLLKFKKYNYENNKIQYVDSFYFRDRSLYQYFVLDNDAVFLAGNGMIRLLDTKTGVNNNIYSNNESVIVSNIVNDKLMINFGAEYINSIINIKIIDIMGRIVKSEKIKAKANTYINISDISNGIYFIRIKLKEKEYKDKIIIIK